jgi:hypothetical protein
MVRPAIQSQFGFFPGLEFSHPGSPADNAASAGPVIIDPTTSGTV